MEQKNHRLKYSVKIFSANYTVKEHQMIETAKVSGNIIKIAQIARS